MRKQNSNPLNSEDFWKNFKKTNYGCWEWMGSKTKAGYGRIWVNPKHIYTHRISWQLIHGKIEDDSLEVCHTCDNPICGNPKHLFLGTRKDNARDSCNKKRNRFITFFGESHTLAKLTEGDIKNIRKIYKPGISGKKSEYSIKGLANTYNVAPSLIHRILQNKSWKHVI